MGTLRSAPFLQSDQVWKKRKLQNQNEATGYTLLCTVHVFRELCGLYLLVRSGVEISHDLAGNDNSEGGGGGTE